ncbi:hypothetical protein JTE90_001317 [Oedothorax gibbosus]|uniref:Delta-like protein n=1 Tax=Oedothorax gibbosus TaxID=931172 RepID=A0AAV6U2P5_9ARAC|nr:hypothetical protein JTE90_001317 [Oedothorax gibbosus]
MGRLYLKSITATALLLIFVAVFPQRVEPFGLFELDLLSLSNSDGREASGGCCSGLRVSEPGGSCPLDQCPVVLRFCITHYQSVVRDLDRCTFFEFETRLLRRQSASSTSYDVAPQQRVSFNMEFGWPNDFTIIVDAWHTPQGGGGKNLVDRFVGQRFVKLNSEWTRDNLTTSRSALGIRYRVVCKEFYYGDACERLCRPRNSNLGHYTCSSHGEIVCMPGWGNISKDDNYCRQPLCDPKCKNGYCVDNNNTHECRCFNGWKGAACDVCVKSVGCKHGRCETNPTQCLCDEGWGGYFCDLDLNYCTNHKPCQNGGTCTNTAPGSFTCKCPDDFIGERCEVYKNPCRHNPCENGGTCNNPSDGQYTCTCAPSYFGPQCDTWANICNDNLCTNGGTCIQDPNGFICSCPLGYEGMFCEKVDSTNCQVYPCRNGGTCVNTSSGFNCMCSEGISGSRCEETLRCSPDSCENGGTCVEQLSGNATCLCPPGYSGTHCQNNHNRCSSNPCANGATCFNTLDPDAGYRCSCPAGYTGPHCSIADHCASSPCLHGATCRIIANGFACDCAKGYRGDRCRVPNDVLASNVSHRISQEEGEPFNTVEVVLISVLSATLVVVVVLVCCVARCIVLRRRRRREEEDSKAKDFEEEVLQNERNLALNNKQCGGDSVARKIVNELHPEMVSPPPKVLNVEVGGTKRIPDKGLVVPAPRAFQKIDNMSGSSISCHSSRACSPCHSGIYVIEDHLQPKKEVLATQV